MSPSHVPSSEARRARARARAQRERRPACRAPAYASAGCRTWRARPRTAGTASGSSMPGPHLRAFCREWNSPCARSCCANTDPPPQGVSRLFACAARREPERGTRRGVELSEGDDVCLDAGLSEDDLEGAVDDRAALPDQLVEPRFTDNPDALLVDVAA